MSFVLGGGWFGGGWFGVVSDSVDRRVDGGGGSWGLVMVVEGGGGGGSCVWSGTDLLPWVFWVS